MQSQNDGRPASLYPAGRLLKEGVKEFYHPLGRQLRCSASIGVILLAFAAG